MREGVTTGTCAAAASKAAAMFAKSGEIPARVCVKNLEGREFCLEVFRIGDSFGVVKDSGDNKTHDVTHGLKIISTLTFTGKFGEIIFQAGEGVGIVTLPGLKIPVGEPAINPVPRIMIANSLREIFPFEQIIVKISIPNGSEIAKHTFNERLGIIGGLSILGTSGVVRAWDEKAYLESLKLELNMIHALEYREIFITFGNLGEKSLRKARNLQSRNIIQAGNYAGFVIDEAAKLGFAKIILAGHPGKLLKIAAGNFNTHSKVSDSRIEVLCTHLAILGADYELIREIYDCNLTDEALRIIMQKLNRESYAKFWQNISEAVCRKCRERVNVNVNNVEFAAIFLNHEGKMFGNE